MPRGSAEPFRTLRASGLDAGCAALISVYRWPSQAGGL